MKKDKKNETEKKEAINQPGSDKADGTLTKLKTFLKNNWNVIAIAAFIIIVTFTFCG
jgi:hypothetical protein